MRGLLLFLAVMAAAFPAWSRPRVTPPNPTRPYAVTVEFATGDTTDSEAIPVSGFCTVRYEQVSGDDASLYAVTTDDTAASSGTLIKAFTASSTTATTFTAGTRWVKAVATDATAGGSVMTIECAPATGAGGGGGHFDAEVNISYSTTPCEDINNAIAEAMDAGSGVWKRIRVHHEDVQEVDIAAQTQYEDLGPQKSCVVVHPVNDDSLGYPNTVADGDTSLNADQGLYLYFDNIRPVVSQASLSENACFLDVGGGWLAGHNGAGTYYGNPGQNVAIEGNIFGRVGTQNSGSFDDRSIPSPSSSARLNADSVSAHSWFCAHRVSDTQMGNLTIVAENNDDDDFVGHMTNTWGSTLPKLIAEGGEGICAQFNGVINANITGQCNALDYGVVLGTPDKRGDVEFYSSCAGTCTEAELGVRGVIWAGGVIEGNTYANFVDIGSERRNIFRDVHWECGTAACQYAGLLIKPHFCDGATGTTPVAEDIPAINAEATECAASGGVAAAAPETSDEGSLVFAGRSGPAGDSAQTEDISPAIFFGEDFIHANQVFFTDGIALSTASDASSEYFSFHPSLTRDGQVDKGDSLVASIGLIDTSGAFFADGTGILPANYDRWVDSREEELFWFILEDPPGADGSDWSAGALVPATSGTNECVTLSDWPIADTGIACSGTVPGYSLGFGGEIYFTRASVYVQGGFDTTESCQLGFDTDNTPGDWDWATRIQIPFENGQDLTATENYHYPLLFLQTAGSTTTIEVGDGDYAESGTPNCYGTFQARVGVRGFRFDPFD